MRIPIGDFGNAVARPASAPQVSPGAFGAQEAAANVQLGRAVQQVGDELMQRQQDLNRIKSIRTMAETKNSLYTLEDEITQGISKGEIDPADAQKVWQERSPKLIADRLASVGGDHRELISAQLMETSNSLAGRVRDAATKRTQQNIAGEMVATGEEFARDPDPARASRNYDMMARAMGPQAGWTPAQIETNINTFREKAYATQAYGLVQGSRNSMAALNDVEKRLTSDEFGALDPQRRATLMATVSGYKTSLEQKALAAAQRAELLAARRDRTAAPLAWQAQQLAEQGKPIDPDWIEKTAPQMAGTAYQGVFDSAIKAAGETGAFGMKPLGEMQAQIAKEQGEINTAGWNPERERMLNLHMQIYNAAARGYKADPLTEAVERRALPALAPLDLSAGIEGLATGIRARLSQAKEVEVVSGNAVSPFTADESAQLSAFLKTLPSSQKSEFLGTLYTAFGDDHAYKAAMTQLDGVDPLMARVGARAASREQAKLQSNMLSPDVVQSAGDVSAIMLHGDQLIKQGGKDGVPKYPMPKDDEFLASMRSKVGTLYRGAGAGDGGGNQFVQDAYAVKAYYLGKASQDGDISGMVDSDRMDQAIAAVLGTPVNFHGNGPVLAPWGMDESTFTARANVAVVDAVKAADMQDKMAPYMRNVGLIGAGGGVYFPTLAGVPVTDNDGRPISIRLTPDADSGLDQYGRPLSEQIPNTAPVPGARNGGAKK
ncbi:hypothetical protein D9M72_86120 [compost metagenome]